MEEIYVDSTDLATTWRVQVTPTGGDIGIALIGHTHQYFEIADATFNVNNQGTNLAEWFDYQFPAAGWYGLVIYKTNYSQLPNNINYTVNISIAPSNLHPYTAAGWTHAIVARSTGGCTMGNCLVTSTLPGLSGTTYVNSTSTNDGPNPVTVSFEVRYLLDDDTLEDVTFASLDVGAIALNTNNGLTQTIKGGRHTLGVYTDANNDYGELDEFDNRFYTQYVWSPYILANNTPFTTTAPPDRTTAGGFTYYNCDGYEFDVIPSSNQNYWGVVGILPTGGSGSLTNYDIRLHDDYTGAIDGFRIPVVASDTGVDGEVEIIGVNRNNAIDPIWWAGVTQGSGAIDIADYYIYKDLSGLAIDVPSSGTAGNIPVNGVVAVEEIYFDTSDLGVGWTVTVTPTGGDIGIALIDRTVEYFRLGDAVSGTNVNDNGTNGAESFNFTPTTAGYYGLLIYKPDNTEIGNSINYTITISLALSNLRPTQPAGWTYYAVPRSSGGCSQTDCLVTATLPGWATTTYMNEATLNEGPNNVPVAFISRYTLDDNTYKDITITTLAAGVTAFDLNNATGSFIKGGRHTLGLLVDVNNNYTESNESDNNRYRQYVWSPLLLADNTPNASNAPPDRNSTGYTYYNCDGFEFAVVPSGTQYYWGAVGMIPTVSTPNYDIRLHSDYTGSTAGFANAVLTSNSGAAGEVEIIGINRHQSATPTWWAGVIQDSDTPVTGNYTISKDTSLSALSVPSSSGSGIIPANAVVSVEDINVEVADVGTTWRFTVTPTGGDIGIALINQSAISYRLADAITGTWVNTNGANLAETFTFTPTVDGYYALLIFKPNYSQAANSINYTVSITAVTSGIAETPDNNIIPGIPLTIAKNGTTQLTLTWAHSCDQVPGVTHYAIYRGTLASLITGTYNHTAVICDSGTDITETIAADTSSYYYLIVPTDNTQEGGYGFRSGAISRPASTSACFPQNRVACP